jgi:hypothetical protein
VSVVDISCYKLVTLTDREVLKADLTARCQALGLMGPSCSRRKESTCWYRQETSIPLIKTSPVGWGFFFLWKR